jgi:hypothetical protein
MGTRTMKNRLTVRNRFSARDLLRRLDRVAADMNVVLVVLAIGLAALDVTFLVTQKVVDHLPPITHVAQDAAPSASK